MKKTTTLTALIAETGNEIAVSRWFAVEQPRINAFADATEDWQFIHTDPEKAAQSPFGGTIAHGFLSLSLLSAMADDCLPELEGQTMGVNYGFDSLRFLAPVPSGARLRARFTLKSADERRPGQIRLILATVIEIEGSDKPAMAGEWIILKYTENTQ